MQVGPQSSCQQTDPPPLTHTHLDVCRFGFSPGGGGEEQPGNSRDPVCDDSFSRRGWKRRRHCWQIAGFPSPFLRWGLVTCGWSGNPLSSAAQRGPLVGGRWRPWRPLYNSAATKASPEGFAVEAAGLPAPRCFRPSLPLVAPPTLGLEQVGGKRDLGDGAAFLTRSSNCHKARLPQPSKQREMCGWREGGPPLFSFRFSRRLQK